MGKFQSETVVQPADSKEYMHRKESAFDILIRQTIASGLIAFVTVAGLGLVWDWLYWLEFAATLGLITIPVYWYLAVSTWRKDSRPEKPVVVSGADNKPIKMVHVRHDHVNENGHYSTSNYELPEGNWPNSLSVLAKGVLAGRPFTETEWAGPNKPFSIPDFRELRKLGLNPKDPSHKLFVYKNSNAKQQGIVLTKKGRELFEELADDDRDEFVDE